MRLADMHADEEYGMYARHDNPGDVLESDSKYPTGHNPTLGRDSEANK